MDYHLLSGINKYLNQTSINTLCSLDTYNNGFIYTYLYRMPIINIKYDAINEKMLSKEYKYIVKDISSRDELNKIMNYGIHIISIKFRGHDDEINNLPQSLISSDIYENNFNKAIDKLPQSLKSSKILNPDFNKLLDNLPQSLILLKIWGNTFNQLLNNLPQSLKSLKINGNGFNQLLDQLPQSFFFKQKTGYEIST